MRDEPDRGRNPMMHWQNRFAWQGIILDCPATTGARTVSGLTANPGDFVTVKF